MIRRFAGNSESLPPGVTGVDFVPEFDVVLFLLPAEEDFAAADNRGKINQSAVQIFDLDFALSELFEDAFGFGEEANPIIDHLSTHLFAGLEQLTDALVLNG